MKFATLLTPSSVYMSKTLSELEFYDDLVYKFRKIGRKSEFSDHSNKVSYLINERGITLM